MKKTHWKYRLLIWIAKHIVHVPFTVNFTPPYEDKLVAVGFAWSEEDAIRMRANYTTPPPQYSRRARRQIRRAADKSVRRGQA